jgi:hypothetical protein
MDLQGFAQRYDASAGDFGEREPGVGAADIRGDDP